MGDDDRRAYLVAVRDHYGRVPLPCCCLPGAGNASACLPTRAPSTPACVRCREGVLCERVLRSGRKVVALLDPRMAPRREAHAWRDERRGGGGLYAEAAGLQGGRAHLAEWTGRECVLGGSAAMSVKAWQHKDGCPANCLPRNLELELVAGGRDEAAMLRMAQISARGALQHLYSVMGPRQGRRYLAALHSEYCGAPHS